MNLFGELEDVVPLVTIIRELILLTTYLSIAACRTEATASPVAAPRP
jgi:hypothetical protein